MNQMKIIYRDSLQLIDNECGFKIHIEIKISIKLFKDFLIHNMKIKTLKYELDIWMSISNSL